MILMKTIVGKEYRKEGKDGERLYTVIQCCDCGAKTYERKQDKIKQALERGCKHCKHLASTEREEAIQRGWHQPKSQKKRI